MGRTLAEKVWEAHVVRRADGEPDLLFIDLHLVHEVTSPQAFDGLREAGRPVRRADLTIATEDHNIPTIDIDQPIADPVSRAQIETLRRNCAEFGVRLHPLGDVEQGIVHVVGPQLGLTQPGMTVVCGDSHTSTHGAFGALAFGIGTSEVEHVLATQTLPLTPFKTMAITVEGRLPDGVTAKDLILAVIARIGTGGGQGYVLEYRGEAIRALSVEARMTICNMSIEAGARAGMIAPDQATFDYLEGRPHAPTGQDWTDALTYWRSLGTDDDATFDREVVIDATELTPFVTWGTNPGQGAPIASVVPDAWLALGRLHQAGARPAYRKVAVRPGAAPVPLSPRSRARGPRQDPGLRDAAADHDRPTLGPGPVGGPVRVPGCRARRLVGGHRIAWRERRDSRLVSQPVRTAGRCGSGSGSGPGVRGTSA